MSSNQLDDNEILITPEVIDKWKNWCEEDHDFMKSKKDKIWRSYRVWFITIVSNMKMDELCKDESKLESLYEFMSYLLNDQERFLMTFFYRATNRKWRGKPEARMPMDKDRIDKLHISWVDEVSPKHKFWHVHIRISIVQRPIYGISTYFDKPFLQQLTAERFGYKFYVNYGYGHDDSSALEFYMNKKHRDEK